MKWLIRDFTYNFAEKKNPTYFAELVILIVLTEVIIIILRRIVVALMIKMTNLHTF